MKLQTITREQFTKLYLSNPQTVVARKLGVSQPTVCYWAKKLNLKKIRGKLGLGTI